MTHAAADEVPVSAIMTPDVVCVSPDLPIEALEDLFLSKGISGAPVVDADGRPVGVVSKTDLLHHHDGGSGAGGGTVDDVMMRSALCLGTDETIAKAAGLMAYEGLHRLAVTGRDGKVIGLVSSLDVLRWLARENGYTIGNRR